MVKENRLIILQENRSFGCAIELEVNIFSPYCRGHAKVHESWLLCLLPEHQLGYDNGLSCSLQTMSSGSEGGMLNQSAI